MLNDDMKESTTIQNVILYPKLIRKMIDHSKRAFPNESSGIMCGYHLPTLQIIIIKQIYPCLTSESSRSFVQCSEEDLERINRLRKKAKTGEFYGWYHSHSIGLSLSKLDIKSQIKMQKIYDIYIGAVISTNEEIRFFQIESGHDKTIPYIELKRDREIVMGIISLVQIFYQNIVMDLGKILERKRRITKSTIEDFERIIERSTYLENDINEMEKLSQELSNRLSTIQERISELRKDIKKIFHNR